MFDPKCSNKVSKVVAILLYLYDLNLKIWVHILKENNNSSLKTHFVLFYRKWYANNGSCVFFLNADCNSVKQYS